MTIKLQKMIISKLLKSKIKGKYKKEQRLMTMNIPLEIFSDMITKLNYSHTTYVNMGFDETKM